MCNVRKMYDVRKLQLIPGVSFVTIIERTLSAFLIPPVQNRKEGDSHRSFSTSEAPSV